MPQRAHNNLPVTNPQNMEIFTLAQEEFKISEFKKSKLQWVRSKHRKTIQWNQENITWKKNEKFNKEKS